MIYSRLLVQCYLIQCDRKEKLDSSFWGQMENKNIPDATVQYDNKHSTMTTALNNLYGPGLNGCRHIVLGLSICRPLCLS